MDISGKKIKEEKEAKRALKMESLVPSFYGLCTQDLVSN